MEPLLNMIYKALINNSELTSLVVEERIARGWNEPLDVPTVRFAIGRARALGDDNDETSVKSAIINIIVLADGDLEVESIEDVVQKGLDENALEHEEIEIQSLIYLGDERGTYFDSIRKKHRKDIAFSVMFSPISS